MQELDGVSGEWRTVRRRLYDATLEEFKTDVLTNRISDILTASFKQYYLREPTASEKRAWENSLNYVKNVIEYCGLKDNRISIEYELPHCHDRIDVLLFGKDENGQANVVLVELKQWSNDAVKDCENEGNILVKYTSFVEREHPSLQVEGYHQSLEDYMYVFQPESGESRIELNSCVYCHNYSRQIDPVLYYPKFERFLVRYPVFAKEDVAELGEYLKKKLINGDGLAVFSRFVTSRVRASKKLLDHLGKMINEQQVFTLIDEQIAAYNAIMSRAKAASASGEKSVIIVSGGPGTGKSVIALEVMAELLRQGKVVEHATGSAAFTKNLRNIIGRDRKSLERKFKFFFSFTRHRENELDVLICDEAHRIRKDSNDYGVPYHLKSGAPRVDDLIRCAKLSVFFIDEFQVVRPSEIGSIDLIERAAQRFNAKVYRFELKTQFRCSGSDAYLQWLDGMLGIRETDHVILSKKDRMDFRIFSSPMEMKRAIDERNKEKKNCARIVAGFCWPWSDPRPDGSLVNDVVIGDFAMPWEKKDEFWKWATDETGMQQVGTVYTSQGFEFDYIGVIFGEDLVYDKEKMEWKSRPEKSYDEAAKRGNKEFTKHLKNVYRVLMSRAHKGCYVYFMDKGTEEYFKSRIEI
ncbi:MAG: DUF2075 domain-containing protein [Candidatus Micrarchaeota archaeon]|nr:DUF2075 domain-containing protein [Candidatus Micrarchaeota archaeon]